MSKSGQYTEAFWLSLTPKMYQFVKLIAERHGMTMSDVIRQAIREHLDEQEDVMSSRSRLGRTVMRRLEIMQRQLLGQLTHLSKLLLAAVLILLTEQGHDAAQVTRRILNLAKQPALDKLVKGDQ